MLRPSVRDVAAGRWPGILSRIGLPERALTGRHGPCPMCGGSDRFRFDDKDGRGTWYCNQCGAGDGIELVMRIRGIDFKTAAQEIEQAAGVVQPGRQQYVQDDARKAERLRQVWQEAKPLTPGDEAMKYLAWRGLSIDLSPSSIRLHPGLQYHDGARLIGTFPAIVARVSNAEGEGVTLHRTYLSGGKKAPVPSPKKLMPVIPGRSSAGSAVRLFPVTDWIGIAEGIETALAAYSLFNCPTWSCISANGIETFDPPASVKTITIFADNDANYTGQAAAYAAANRLTLRGFDVDVCVPPRPGDWLDHLNEEKECSV